MRPVYIELPVETSAQNKVVGHLDAVGLHGVARAIVEVAHVRVVEVGDALLDHLGHLPPRPGEDFLLRLCAARPCARAVHRGSARGFGEGPARRPGAILAAGHPGALTALESSF